MKMASRIYRLPSLLLAAVLLLPSATLAVDSSDTSATPAVSPTPSPLAIERGMFCAQISTVASRINAGFEPRAYLIERHQAWLKRQSIEG